MTENTLPCADELRAEVRDWLAAHWTALPKSDDPWASSPERIAWLEKVLDAGYAAPTYPGDWYGREYPNQLANVIEQEFRAVRPGRPPGQIQHPGQHRPEIRHRADQT